MYLWKIKLRSVFLIGLLIIVSFLPALTAEVEPIGKKIQQSQMNPSFFSFSDDPQIDQYQTITESNATIPFGVFSEDEIIKLAQSFKPTLPILSKIELLLDKKFNTNPVKISIKESLYEQESLVEIDLSNNELSDYPTWTSVEFEDIEVNTNQTY
jgi:hypothetical protein